MAEIPHTSENIFRVMREDDSWTKDELIDYITDLEKIVREWWEEEKKTYVPVVRCKDCRFGDNFDGAFIRCLNDGNEEDGWNYHYADWFCADGKRREDESQTD